MTDRIATSPGPRLSALARAALAAALACLPLIFTLSPAAADPPSRLKTQVTDPSNVLGDETAKVQATLDRLAKEESIQLWVAYVDSFDGLSATDWVDQTAEKSNLGGNDLLFAVATQDRDYGYNAAATGPSDAEIETVIARSVEPKLAASQWADAAIAMADGLRGSAPAPSEGGSGGGLVVPLLIGGVAVVGGGGYFYLRSRRAGPGGSVVVGGDGAAAPVVVSEAGLRQQAAAALIEADDSIKTSEQELGFAIAQFGEAAAAPFSAALEQSRADVKGAFALQQKLDDDQEDSPAERGAWLGEIIDRCRTADQRLDEQVSAFDALREMDRNVEKILPDLAGKAKALAGRIPAAKATLLELATHYPPAALKLLGDNLTEAGNRIEFATSTVTKGQELLASGDRAGAVANARAAEEAIGQAHTLLETLERAPGEMAQAQAAISALIAETEKDLAEAGKLGVGPTLQPTFDHASQTLTWAQQVISSGNYDPMVTRRALDEADSALENALVPARGAAEEKARATALLKGAAEACVASIQAAQDFITTRRGGVGAEARTRLAEAERRSTAAVPLADSDPKQALAEIQQADRLADQALAIAQRDEQEYRNQQNRQSNWGGMGGLGNIVLGGILIDAMSGGRRGGGGSSGGGRGGGFNFPSGGGGASGPGSFGGGGTRGRRSGGGRF
ncbi:MAG: TPM domain-containing protein [Candidatus Nanopelagicales bacterium]